MSWLFKSTVKIWAKLDIRNLVRYYHVLQVTSWICGGLGSWLVLKSSSLSQVSLLWKFELNWMSGCWEKFVWCWWWWWVGGWHSRIESLQVHLTLDFWLWTWTWIETLRIYLNNFEGIFKGKCRQVQVSLSEWLSMLIYNNLCRQSTVYSFQRKNSHSQKYEHRIMCYQQLNKLTGMYVTKLFCETPNKK